MKSTASFFQRYALAYLAFDVDVISAFFHLPCLIIDERGEHLLQQGDDVRRYQRPFLARLRAADLARIETDVVTERPLDGASCFCSVRYRLEGKQQNLLGDLDFHYVLNGDDGDGRIKLVKTGQIRSWAL